MRSSGFRLAGGWWIVTTFQSNASLKCDPFPRSDPGYVDREAAAKIGIVGRVEPSYQLSELAGPDLERCRFYSDAWTTRLDALHAHRVRARTAQRDRGLGRLARQQDPEVDRIRADLERKTLARPSLPNSRGGGYDSARRAEDREGERPMTTTRAGKAAQHEQTIVSDEPRIGASIAEPSIGIGGIRPAILDMYKRQSRPVKARLFFCDEDSDRASRTDEIEDASCRGTHWVHGPTSGGGSG